MPQTHIEDVLASSSSGGKNILRKLFPFYMSVIQGQLKRFFDDYCEEFDTGESKLSEHRLEWTNIHKKYKLILGNALEDFCEEEDLSYDEVYKNLAKVKSEGTRREQMLLKVIQAQDEYETFVKMMRDEALRRASTADATTSGASTKISSSAPKSRSK
eukprot:g416.t1